MFPVAKSLFRQSCSGMHLESLVNPIFYKCNNDNKRSVLGDGHI